MNGKWLLERAAQWPERKAILGEGVEGSYADLIERAAHWHKIFDAEGIVGPGRVVAFNGDYSARSVSLLLALLERSCVAVPLASADETQRSEFLEISHAEFLVPFEKETYGKIVPLEQRGTHQLFNKLAELGQPGLVLFTSGSTGRPKALLHDMGQLLEKFRKPRHCFRIITFLFLDHIGGD